MCSSISGVNTNGIYSRAHVDHFLILPFLNGHIHRKLAAITSPLPHSTDREHSAVTSLRRVLIIDI